MSVVGGGRAADRVLRASAVLLAATAVTAFIALAFIDFADDAWGLAWVGFPVVGALILWQRPTNRIGWLLVGLGVGFSSAELIDWYAMSGIGPGPVLVEVSGLPIGSVTWLLLIALIALFPAGTAAGRLERVIIRGLVAIGGLVVVAAFASPRPLDSGRSNPLAADWLAGMSDLVMGPGFALVLVLLAAALTSLVLRWRDSRGPERLQFRWLIWSTGFTIAVIAAAQLSPMFGGGPWVVVLNAIPVSIGIAVTRYHLYDIDRVISRTTSYAIVTGLLIATYSVIVTTATRWLDTDSALVVAGATLAAAALARPALNRVQGLVDRHFNRARYDARRTVEAFGAQLRHTTRPELVSRDLLAAVHETFQPASVSLWVRS